MATNGGLKSLAPWPSTACVAFDIEVAGRTYGHPIFSVGGWLGSHDGTFLDAFQINIAVKWPSDAEGKLFEPDPSDSSKERLVPVYTITSYGDFDPDQWADFWSKQPAETIKLLRSNPVEASTAWRMLQERIDGWDERITKLTLLSDCLEYDIGRINLALWENCRRRGLNYNSRNEWRTGKGADDLFDTMPPPVLERERAHLAKMKTTAHLPVDDAHRVYCQWVAFQEYRKSIKAEELKTMEAFEKLHRRLLEAEYASASLRCRLIEVGPPVEKPNPPADVPVPTDVDDGEIAETEERSPKRTRESDEADEVVMEH